MHTYLSVLLYVNFFPNTLLQRYKVTLFQLLFRSQNSDCILKQVECLRVKANASLFKMQTHKKIKRMQFFFLTKSYKYPHNSSPICWNVPHPSPVIWLHGKIVQGLHTQVNTQTITYNGIHDPLHTKVTNTCVTNTCPLVYTAIPRFS